MTTIRSRRTTPRRRALATLATAFVAVVAVSGLSGCSDSKLGAAAVVDDEVITVDQLQQATRDYLDIVPGADPGDAQVAILQRHIVSAVIDEVARQNDVHVPPGRIAAERDDLFANFEGRRGLVRTLANSQQQPTVLAPDDVERWVKDRLLFNAIAEKIGGKPLNTADPESQQVLEELQNQLTKAGGSLDIEVNPRYGTWNPESGVTPLVSGGLAKTADELKKSDGS